MNDIPQDAWFYSHEGERIGPVPFSDLRIRAKEGGLNPRLDLVWTHGMAEWKPSGEIDGLFERRAAPEAPESLSPTVDPYTSPGHESAAEYMGKEGEWPGAGRGRYLFTIIVLPFLLTFGIATLTTLVDSQFGNQVGGLIMLGVMILTLLIVIQVNLQRLVNLGMSRWWFLGHLVPILNIWLGYRIFACPGGYAYHKKLDGIGIVLAIFYWLTTLAGILALIGVIAISLGAVGSPELREKIQQEIREAIKAKSPQTP